MASLKDVALLAGVSTATVSRAINNPDVVDPVRHEKAQLPAQSAGQRASLQN